MWVDQTYLYPQLRSHDADGLLKVRVVADHDSSITALLAGIEDQVCSQVDIRALLLGM